MGFLGMEPGGVGRAGRRCFGSDLVWFFALPITVHIAFMFAFIFLSPLFFCIAVGLIFLYLLGGFFFWCLYISVVILHAFVFHFWSFLMFYYGFKIMYSTG